MEVKAKGFVPEFYNLSFPHVVSGNPAFHSEFSRFEFKCSKFVLLGRPAFRLTSTLLFSTAQKVSALYYKRMPLSAKYLIFIRELYHRHSLSVPDTN